MKHQSALLAAFGVLALSCAPSTADLPVSHSALRFYGTGVGPPGQQDRVRIRIDDDAPSPTPDASAPCDLGSGSFTVEFWVRGELSDNATANDGGDNEFFDFRWIEGNIIIDRDIYGGSSRDWGISIAGGSIRFGTGAADVSPQDVEHTIEGGTNVLDGDWHHVAVVRDQASGAKSIYVDGVLDFASPLGRSRDDISYPDQGVAAQQTPWGPFIVIAAEKHDAGAAYPSFSGFVDEVRLWRRALTPMEIANWHRRVIVAGSAVSAGLVGAYRFEEGAGTVIGDSSSAGSPAGELIAGVPGNGQWTLRVDDPATVAPVTRCAGDADGDLSVSFSDVASILSSFGAAVPGGAGAGDADASGAVDFGDIAASLASFGMRCP